MSSHIFSVREHIIPGQHIREYPDATAEDQDEILQLNVKQYVPLHQTENVPHDALTIIGAHANGFPKELYEPLWDDLYDQLKQRGIFIRSFWLADVAHQGASSLLNEDKLGNDPSWFDHSRDLLYMINHFRTQMPRPLAGIGHSMGGCQLVNLSLMHPRLLTTLILLDPVIHDASISGPPERKFHIAHASTHRRDIWPSRQAAEASFNKSPFYQAWDPRVLKLWIEFGLRALPTKLYPNIHKGGLDTPVTLSTTKHQEVWTFLRPNFSGQDSEGHPVYNKTTHADLDKTSRDIYPFYRPEPTNTLHNLPFLRPSVLYVFGETSNMSNPVFRKQKMDFTGTGTGGSGGAREGRVKEVVLLKIGHLIPMEAVTESAKVAAEWLDEEVQRWRDEEQRRRLSRKERNPLENIMVSQEWVRNIGGDLPKRPREQSAKI